MQIFNASGQINKTPEVLAHLYEQVLADPVITELISQIELDPQIWGSSALHVAGQSTHSGTPVLLKLHVPGDQLWWTRQLSQQHPALQPIVYATGERIGELPLGWVLWERVRTGLHPGWGGREFEMLLEAGVRFQLAARPLAQAAHAVDALAELRLEDLAKQLEAGIAQAAPGPATRVLDRLAEDWAWVNQVCEHEICHGDLHMANALCRDDPPGGTALLIDCHPMSMPWAWEPAKPEILNADPARVGCRGLIAKQAALRTKLGLSAPTGKDLERLQAILLGWCAIQIWASIGPDPDPAWRDPRIWHAENLAFITAAAQA